MDDDAGILVRLSVLEAQASQWKELGDERAANVIARSDDRLAAMMTLVQSRMDASDRAVSKSELSMESRFRAFEESIHRFEQFQASYAGATQRSESMGRTSGMIIGLIVTAAVGLGGLIFRLVSGN
jgi:hypothetical protein